MAQTSLYGLKYQSRCLLSNLSNLVAHQFYIGTNSVRDLNEIHLIEYNEDNNDTYCNAIFIHPYEIWSLSNHKNNKNSIVSAYFDGENKATLWKWDEVSEIRNQSVNLTKVFDLTGHTKRIHTLEWCAEDNTSFVSMDNSDMKIWKFNESSAILDATLDGNWKAGCFDPHHNNLFLTANDMALQSYDLRSKSCTVSIPNAHTSPICAVDYNPNKLYSVVSSSEDRRIKFWDLRKPTLPIKILTGHTHWVSCVKYNRFHDQLICSAGTDALVNLWSVLSISSAPVGDLEDHSTEGLKDGDKLVKSYDENEESVYSIAWSASDAWLFATLSYDGRVVIRTVPSQEKYKILL